MRLRERFLYFVDGVNESHITSRRRQESQFLCMRVFFVYIKVFFPPTEHPAHPASVL